MTVFASALVEAGIGQTLPPKLVLEDDIGVAHPLRELSDRPWLLVPVFTRCPAVCPLTVQTLLRETALIADPSSYRVVLFSFDPHESIKDLKAFRYAQKIPPSWLVTRATNASDALALLEAAGIQTATDTAGGFIHPAEVEVVAPTLQIRARIATVDLTSLKIKQAILTAASVPGANLFARYPEFILPMLVFGLILCGGWVAHLVKARSTRI